MPDDQANPPVPPGGSDSPKDQQQPGDAAPTAITIDGQTYGSDQVKELLKAKADYDQLTPEFTRRSQILTNPDQLLEYARKTYPDRFPAQPPAPLSPDEQALAEADKILKSRGYLTKDEAEKLADERMSRLLDQRDADTSIKTEAEKLGKEWDGTNGKPKFDIKAVAQYALDHGHPTLTSAFREMNFDALSAYFASQKATKPKAPVIAGPGGGAAPVKKDKPVRLDDESFDRAWEEHFGS